MQSMAGPEMNFPNYLSNQLSLPLTSSFANSPFYRANVGVEV